MDYISPIFECRMTNAEAEVYRLAVLYEKEFRRVFPEADGQSRRRNFLPQRRDPRKSNLFRNCWRLRRETRGLLESHEYPDYIRANLEIIKANHGHVEPNAVCGDRAWVRYKVWKRFRDRKASELACAAPPPCASPVVLAQIDRTKKFLYERCEGQPSLEGLRKFVENGAFRLWLLSGKVSPLYVVLSPYVAAICDLKELAAKCNFSIELMMEKVAGGVGDYIRQEFSYEFTATPGD